MRNIICAPSHRTPLIGASIRMMLTILMLTILMLALGACRKGASVEPDPSTEIPPTGDIPVLTPQTGTPMPETEALTPPTAAPPTLDFGDVQRTEVLTTTVQAGDTVYAIAFRYDLEPESIVWANPDIMAAPWLIKPGQALTVLPVDGVYHLVQPGETTAQVASRYGVDVGALVNPWNDLEPGAEPVVGQWLVVPGGKGPDPEWEPHAP